MARQSKDGADSGDGDLFTAALNVRLANQAPLDARDDHPRPPNGVRLSR